MMTKETAKTGLELLREPFKENQISLLPKPYKRDSPKGKCQECGGYHGMPAVHLKYVGHAALTDRLLDCDPSWNWEPLAFDERGQPLIDQNGGMWIRLTVCGQSRLGYGHPDGKKGGDAIKETIGDALRNAAMRFGAALDLWHKGDLRGVEDDALGQNSAQSQQHQNNDAVLKGKLKAAWDRVKNWHGNRDGFSDYITSPDFLALESDLKTMLPNAWNGTDGKPGLSQLIDDKMKELEAKEDASYGGRDNSEPPF